MAMINRNVKLILATLALVAGVFCVECLDKLTKDDINIVDTKVNLQDYQQYKLGSGNVGLPIFYLNGSMDGITKDKDVKLEWRFNDKKGKLKCNIQGGTAAGFPKKNYTINHIKDAFDVGWGLRNKYTLKADYVDCSHARNVIGAKLWGQIVKNRTKKNEKLRLIIRMCG